LDRVWSLWQIPICTGAPFIEAYDYVEELKLVLHYFNLDIASDSAMVVKDFLNAPGPDGWCFRDLIEEEFRHQIPDEWC
jgi:hypothetical protein